MSGILGPLRGGDRRSIGRSNEVARQVLDDPALFGPLFQGMLHPDPLIRMRAADAVEKVTTERPAWLAPYREDLLDRVAAVEQREVRWHVAQMIPRLCLTEEERTRAVEILFGYLDDKSRIVQTFSLQALADLAERDAQLAPRVIETLWAMVETGSPAVRSRGRKLLAQLDTAGGS